MIKKLFFLLSFLLFFSFLYGVGESSLEIYFLHLNNVDRIVLKLDNKTYLLRKPYFRKTDLSAGEHYLEIKASGYQAFSKKIILDKGNNVLEIGLKNKNYQGEDFSYYQAVVPYVNEAQIKTENVSESLAFEKKHFPAIEKKEKSSQNQQISFLGISGYVYQPDSFISSSQWKFGYRRINFKSGSLEKNGDNLVVNCRLSNKDEVGISYLKVDDSSLIPESDSDDEVLLSYKRFVKKISSGDYLVSVSVSDQRIDLSNIWGTYWNKKKAHLDFVLENTFYSSESKFKVGLANRFYLNDGFSLVLEGKYNLTDSYSQAGITFEKAIKSRFLVNVGFYWSDLEEDVDLYHLGIETKF